MKRLPVAQVKRDFRAVLDAAERGESTLVLRRGRPVAAILPAQEVSGRPSLPTPRRDGGLLALAGILQDWETIDQDVAALIAARSEVLDRLPPALE